MPDAVVMGRRMGTLDPSDYPMRLERDPLVMGASIVNHGGGNPPRTPDEWQARAVMALTYHVGKMNEVEKGGDPLYLKTAERLHIPDAAALVMESLEMFEGPNPPAELSGTMLARLEDLESRLAQLNDEIGPRLSALAIGAIALGGLVLLVGLSFLFSAAEAAGAGAGTRIITPRIRIQRE